MRTTKLPSISLAERAQQLRDEGRIVSAAQRVLSAMDFLRDVPKVDGPRPGVDPILGAFARVSTSLEAAWASAQAVATRFGGKSSLQRAEEDLSNLAGWVSRADLGTTTTSFSKEENRALSVATSATWAVQLAEKLNKPELSAELRSLTQDDAPLMRELTQRACDVLRNQRPVSELVVHHDGLPPMGNQTLVTYLDTLAGAVERDPAMLLVKQSRLDDSAPPQPLAPSQQREVAAELRRVASSFDPKSESGLWRGLDDARDNLLFRHQAHSGPLLNLILDLSCNALVSKGVGEAYLPP